jgi:hypothetical protein
MHKCDEDFAGLENLGVSKICEYVGLTSFRITAANTRLIGRRRGAPKGLFRRVM